MLAEPTSGAAAPQRTPSPLQQRVLDFVRRQTGHGVVEATAGSGKTTTLVQVARQLPASGTACFLAFNRATAAELRARLPAHVDATTIHALGRAMLLAGLPQLRGSHPTPDKYRSLARGLLRRSLPDADSSAEAADYLARLADVARLALVDTASAAELAALADHFRLESPLTPEPTAHLHGMLPPLLAAGRQAALAGQLDFTDMLHLPLTMALPPPTYDFVCVDEAQDLSPLSLALIMRLAQAGARMLFVGDPQQAIYAFAGAGRRSLARIIGLTQATVLPLSVSFRCPNRHVALARRFSPAMQAAPAAAAGSVRLLPFARLPQLVQPGDLIMCRINAPLVGLCLQLAASGVPARVLGQDLAQPVLALAHYLFGRRLPTDAAQVVARHARWEAQKLERALLTSSALAEALRLSQQRHKALALLLRRLGPKPQRDLGALQQLAYDLLVPAEAAETQPNAVLSTIHKAKGREAQRVFLLFPEELAPPPGWRAGADENAAEVGSTAGAEQESEGNVLFVALTRATSRLILVERHAGAVAARLTGARAQPDNQRSGAPAALLAAQWNDVLSLATVMDRARGGARRKVTNGRRPWARTLPSSS